MRSICGIRASPFGQVTVSQITKNNEFIFHDFANPAFKSRIRKVMENKLIIFSDLANGNLAKRGRADSAYTPHYSSQKFSTPKFRVVDPRGV